MRLIPRRHRAHRPFPGILLRISTVNGPVVEADSQHLFYAARYGTEGCTAACSDDCTVHGWFNLMAGGMDQLSTAFGLEPPSGEFSVVPLKIEIRPAWLFDARAL